MKLQTTFRLKEDFLLKLVLYAFSIILLLSGKVMWNYVTVAIGGHMQLWLYLGLALCGVIFFMICKNVSEKTLLVTMACTLILCMYALIVGADIKKHLVYYIIPFIFYIFIACELIRAKKMTAFLQCFSNVIVILAAFSIFFWFFGSLLNIVPGRTRMTYLWAERHNPTFTYFMLYFENPVQATIMMGREIPRNTGFCPESPGYSSHLVYALIIEALYFKNKNKWKTAILVLAILSSLSTKGLFFLMEYFLLSYLFTQRKKVWWKQLLVFFGGVLILAGVIFASSFIMEEKSNTGSYSVRSDDIRAELLTWLEHPIFGIGLYDSSEIIAKFRVYRPNSGLSMGLTAFMAQGGIYMIAMYFFPPLYIFLRIKDKETRNRFIIAFVMVITDFVLSMVQNVPYFMFLIAVLYGEMVYMMPGKGPALKEYVDKLRIRH